jgi:hypothetical protein
MSLHEELSKPLFVNEIDFRIQSINNGGYATILAYKDARVDMNRLNRVLGPGKWQRKHDLINGSLFCSLGIWCDEIKQWSWVQDVGTQSYTEKEKGEASDSFKRACFNLGIGIELYDYPLINVKLNDNEWTKGEGNKANKQTWNLKLKDWRWSIQMIDSEILNMSAKDEKGSIRFNYKGDVSADKVARRLVEKYEETITNIKDGLEAGDLVKASEAWYELNTHEKSELWIAERDGGMFNAAERKSIQSSEFRKAHYGDDK